MNRPTIEYTLAGKCNQLAWLLSKTKQRPEEALQLSLRSLELIPNYSVYQDTLARCYFAIGDVDKAISTQKLAISRRAESAHDDSTTRRIRSGQEEWTIDFARSRIAGLLRLERICPERYAAVFENE